MRTKLRIEPCAAALLKRVDGSLRASTGGEDVEVLGNGADTTQQRDLLPPDAVGMAAAVPPLIEAAYRLGSKVAHSEFGDDRGAAVVAKVAPLLAAFMGRPGKDPGELRCRVSRWQNTLPKSFEWRRI